MTSASAHATFHNSTSTVSLFSNKDVAGSVVEPSIGAHSNSENIPAAKNMIPWTRSPFGWAAALLRSLAVLILLVVFCENCSAQGLFGERNLGGTLSRRTRPNPSTNPGTIEEGRRFLRDERSVNDFVGSNTTAEAASGFVGGQSTATTAVSSVVGLREEARPRLNRPRIIRPTGIYAERLTLSGDIVNPESGTSTNGAAIPRISDSLQSFIQQRAVTIEASPEDRSAILRGAVPSEADRRQIELLVMFEPGIKTVVNELTVDSNMPPILRRKRPMNLPE